MHRSAAACTVFCLALLCAAPDAGTVTRSELISYDTLRNATFSGNLVHEFSEKPRMVRVTVKCKLKSGSFAWRVLNSKKQTVWKNSIAGKLDFELTDEFPGEAGEWRIVIDSVKAKGKYHVKMEAIN